MAEFLFPLIQREQVASGTTAFTFSTEESGFSFQPGQNADFTNLNQPTQDAKGATRTFSIASASRADGTLVVATRMRPSSFKNWWAEMPLGTQVRVVGPSGDMTLHDDANKPTVMLAGGIGVTPFRAMIEDVVTQHKAHQLFLLASNRHIADAPFHEEFERWNKEHRQFTYVPTVTEEPPADWLGERGYITADMIHKHVSDPASAMYYLAGPLTMVQAMRHTLLDMGVSKDMIRQEEFTGY